MKTAISILLTSAVTFVNLMKNPKVDVKSNLAFSSSETTINLNLDGNFELNKGNFKSKLDFCGGEKHKLFDFDYAIKQYASQDFKFFSNLKTYFKKINFDLENKKVFILNDDSKKTSYSVDTILKDFSVLNKIIYNVQDEYSEVTNGCLIEESKKSGPKVKKYDKWKLNGQAKLFNGSKNLGTVNIKGHLSENNGQVVINDEIKYVYYIKEKNSKDKTTNNQNKTIDFHIEYDGDEFSYDYNTNSFIFNGLWISLDNINLEKWNKLFKAGLKINKDGELIIEGKTYKYNSQENKLVIKGKEYSLEELTPVEIIKLLEGEINE